MARPGPKPTPTELKIHEGNPGKRSLNAEEPEVAACEAVPEPPEHLDDEAKAEWQRVAPALVGAKVLTELDRAVMAGYCMAWSAFVKADRQVQEHGDVLFSKKTDKGGNKTETPYMSPYVNLRAMAMKQMLTYGAEMGLTPASRSRIHVGGKKDTDGFDNGCDDARSA
jgi:P27 family predicted phage terminase small subunit